MGVKQTNETKLAISSLQIQKSSVKYLAREGAGLDEKKKGAALSLEWLLPLTTENISRALCLQS
jgi:hypothetical protein